ncbi:unnamed protein product, partial [Heterotrigona itama]
LYGGFYADTEPTTMSSCVGSGSGVSDDRRRGSRRKRSWSACGNQRRMLSATTRYYREWFCRGISERVVLYATEGCYTTRTMIRRTSWWK